MLRTFAIICVTLLAGVSPAASQMVTVNTRDAAGTSTGTYVFDVGHSITSASIVAGSPLGPASLTQLENHTGTGVLPKGRSLGVLLGAPDDSVNGKQANLGGGGLGDAIENSVFEANWGGSVVLNQPGADFLLFEGGASVPSGMEAFAVAVRPAGGAFTSFRYEFVEGFDPGSGNVSYLTAFDLSDFGLDPGAAIDAIRVANLLAADRVTGSDGQGFVNFAGPGFVPDRGPLAPGPFAAGRFDADIEYVFALSQPAAVPEPGACGLCFMTACAAWLWRRRRAACLAPSASSLPINRSEEDRP